ncbi:MAG TPA: hypothetical protein VGE66_05175 [Chitinophagaceae bacterium]
MIPLLVLIGSFILLLVARRLNEDLTTDKAGRIAFGVMLLFTGTSHFYLTKGMVMSMPPFFPAKEALVYFTGVLEIAFALAFMVAKNKPLVAKLLILFLVAVFPANIYAALNNIDMENADHSGPGPAYLFFRAPLQLLFISWVYYFGIQRPRQTHYRGRLKLVPRHDGRVEVVTGGEKPVEQQRYWD